MDDIITIQEIEDILKENDELTDAPPDINTFILLTEQKVEIDNGIFLKCSKARYGNTRNQIMLFQDENSTDPIMFERGDEDGVAIEDNTTEGTFWRRIK